MPPESLKFHIEQNDYFGTLATVLDLIRQDLDTREYRRHSVALAALCNELMYLQRSHRIEALASKC
jgi:hypothetical protein